MVNWYVNHPQKLDLICCHHL